MRPFYYIVLFFSSLLLADIGAFQLIKIGTSIYMIDFFFIYFFVCFAVVGVKTNFKFYSTNKLFLFFLFILLLSITYGITKYGFSAIGEGRYIYWLLFFTVPLYFYFTGDVRTLRDYDKLFKVTYFFVIVNVLVLLVIEVLNGGRFFLAPENKEFLNLEDERGMRYLGSEETFHLGVGLIFLLIDQYINKGKNRFKTILIIILTAIILFTKNRAALLSLCLSFGVVMILEGKAKVVLKVALAICILVGLSLALFPSLTQSVIAPIQGAFNVTEDETGSWRLLVQAVALQQAMLTPVFGQGFGGYFEYYVEQIGEVINYPPHSMYIYLFQKSGAIGLLSYIVALIALIRESSSIKKFTANNAISEKYRLLLKVLLIAQIPYGFAYNYSSYLGLYIGMLVVLKKIAERTYQNNILSYEPA